MELNMGKGINSNYGSSSRYNSKKSKTKSKQINIPQIYLNKNYENYINLIKNSLFLNNNSLKEIFQQIDTSNLNKPLLTKILIKILADEFIKAQNLAKIEINKGNILTENKLTILKFLKSNIGQYLTGYNLRELKFYTKHHNTINNLLKSFVNRESIKLANSNLNKIKKLLTTKSKRVNSERNINQINSNSKTIELSNLDLKNIKKILGKTKILKITDCKNIKNLINNVENPLNLLQLYSLDLNKVNIKLKSIKKLIVSDCKNIKKFITNLNQDIEHLELQDLDLRNIKLKLNNLNYLKTLDLTNCKLNENTLKGLNTNIQNLKLYNMDLDNFKLKINNDNLKIILTSCKNINNFIKNHKKLPIKSIEIYSGSSTKLKICSEKLQKLKIFNYRPEKINISGNLEEISLNHNSLHKITYTKNIQKLNIINDEDRPININYCKLPKGFKEISFINPCFLTSSNKPLEIPASVKILKLKYSTKIHHTVSITKNPLDKIILKNPNTKIFIDNKLINNNTKICESKQQSRINNEFSISLPELPLKESRILSRKIKSARLRRVMPENTPLITPRNTPINTPLITPRNTPINTPLITPRNTSRNFLGKYQIT
jgi:hypothetical protein